MPVHNLRLTPPRPRHLSLAAPVPADAPLAERDPDLSVVIPVHNEAGHILSVVCEIEVVLDNMAGRRLNYEIIVVDDFSSDLTPDLLTAARERHPRLRTIRLAGRGGQSAALWTGVMCARGRWVATLDGDGQNDPADLPRLIAAAEPMVPGDRFLIAGIRSLRQDSWTKRWASLLANSVRARVLGDGISDTGCGIKLFDRRAFLDLPYFDHMHRFLPALMQAQAVAVGTVKVGHRPRRFGRSNYGMLDRLGQGLIDMLGVLWLRRRMSRPAIERED